MDNKYTQHFWGWRHTPHKEAAVLSTACYE